MARTDLLFSLIRTSLRRLMETNLTTALGKGILILAACALGSSWVVAPAWAQRVPMGGHAGGGRIGGGVRVNVPPRAGATIPRPRTYFGPHPVGLGPGNLGFGRGPIHFFHPRPFFARRFFRFGLAYSPVWWPGCGGSWTWGWGINCYYPPPVYAYGFENFTAPQLYEVPAYVYGGGEPDLVWLYLKDGAVYGVTDYWFVNGQLHFTTFDAAEPKPAEHVIPSEQLDAQKTSYVNTRRGFRMVIRDEPWQQYLKDHPDLTPPDLLPAEKKEP